MKSVWGGLRIVSRRIALTKAKSLPMALYSPDDQMLVSPMDPREAEDRPPSGRNLVSFVHREVEPLTSIASQCNNVSQQSIYTKTMAVYTTRTPLG